MCCSTLSHNLKLSTDNVLSSYYVANQTALHCVVDSTALLVVFQRGFVI